MTKSIQIGLEKEIALADVSDTRRVAPDSCMDGSQQAPAYPLRKPNTKETTSPCPVPLAEVLGVSLIDPTVVTFYL